MRQFEGLAIGAFDQFEQMLGPLSEASMSLTLLEDEFGGMISVITDGLPRAVQTMAAFAEVTEPVLSMVLGQLMSSNVLTFFTGQLARMQPLIFVLIGSLKQLLPAIVRISEGALFVVTTMMAVASAFAIIINRVPLLGQLIGAVASVMAVLVSISTTAYLVNLALQKSLLGTAVSFIKTKFAALAASYGIGAATLAVVALTAALTFGLSAALTAVSGGFIDFADSIGLANSELKSLNNGVKRFNELTPGDVGTGGQLGVNGRSPRGGGNSYTTVIDANGQDAAARQQYSESYERQHVDSVFGG